LARYYGITEAIATNPRVGESRILEAKDFCDDLGGLAHYCRGSLLEVIRCIEVASNSQSQPSIPYTLNVRFWNLDFPSTNAANSIYMFLVSCMRLAESLASNGVNNRLQPTTKRPVLGSAEFWRPSFTYFWMLYVEYKCRKSQQLGRRIEGCWLARTAIIPYE